jgi:hypothetical protein
VVAFIEMRNGILISPQEVLAMDTLERLGRALKERGISLEQLMESGRDIRGEMIAKDYGLRAQEENWGFA